MRIDRFSKIIVLKLLFFVKIYPSESLNTVDENIKACEKDLDCQKEENRNADQNYVSASKCLQGFCECAPGYFGWQCEFASCDDYTKCLNDGECMIIENRHYCSCSSDYTGEFCETYVCDNTTNCDGVCTSPTECKCNDRLSIKYGTKCTPDCSVFDPCQNGGICDSQSGKYECSCKNGFVGSRCEKPVCDSSWCKGFCSQDDCICLPGFTGMGCEQANCSDFTECETVGKCDDSHNDIRCVCDERKYGGKYCEYQCENECQFGICGADGTCYCESGYDGIKCEKAIQIADQMRIIGFRDSAIVLSICGILVMAYCIMLKRRI